jgi:hypothetical protein
MAVAKQRHACNNGNIVGSGVFYVVSMTKGQAYSKERMLHKDYNHEG